MFMLLVLGTWAWGDKKTWSWDEELNGKAKEAFEMSISKGINTFDTAEVYGNGERWVEKKLKLIIKLLHFSERCIARYKANQTEDIVIATKFLPYPYRLSYPKSLINALRASLERLQV
jgi:pyridoxine 4-dehydrogenase